MFIIDKVRLKLFPQQ